MYDQKLQLEKYLSEFVTNHKKQRIQEVLAERTRYLTVVLEDIYQPHNASAVLRSCDCFGIQDVHIIEQNNKYQINNDVALGSSKWLSLNRYRDKNIDNTLRCINHLKSQGYQIAATTLRSNSIPIQSLKLNKKTALCFGTEELGLSEKIHNLADIYIKIPMYGFTQSFNISVSAAICLFALTEKLKHSAITWQITEEEKIDIRINWLTTIIPNGKKIVERYKHENQLFCKS